MAAVARSAQLADWALTHGRSSLSTADLAGLLDVPVEQVSRRLAAAVARREWVSPARGLWIPVAPEFRSWGAPPGLEFVDLLAAHLGVDYYVGWLSAAALHGAAHHAPQAFQVAVSRHVRDRNVGQTRLTFRIRPRAGKTPVEARETRDGSARVSTPEATALDLARDVTFAGGIDNVATVLAELDEETQLGDAALAAQAKRAPAAAARRLGWLLQEFAGRDDLDRFRGVALAGPATPARVDPTGSLRGPLDPKWNVRVNWQVDADL